MKLFGRKLSGSTEQAAADWVRNNLSPRPENFIGTSAQLQSIISSQSDACAQTAKKSGFFVGASQARQICNQEINKAYEGVLSNLNANSLSEDLAAQNEAKQSTMILYIITAFILFILIISII